MMKCVHANWNPRPKTLLKIKAHFINFIGLHSVQHVTIVFIKCFHLFIVVFGFFQEVHQSLSVLLSGDDLLIECFYHLKHVIGLVDCLVNLLDGMFDIELSCQALCFPSLFIPLYFTKSPFILHALVDILLLEFNDVIFVLYQGLFHCVKGISN